MIGPAMASPSKLVAPRSSGLLRPGGKSLEVIGFEEEMVEFFVEGALLLGVPKSVAAIYGICFASAEPLNFSEIEQKLNFSKGSISQGLRVLREMGALKTVQQSGSRREAYEPELELRKLVGRWLDERLKKHLNSGKGRLHRIAAKLPEGPTGSEGILAERLSSLQSWHSKGTAVLPLVKAFLKVT